LITRFNQPENILVSYELNGDEVIDFKMVVADWGSAAVAKEAGSFCGGTPIYAGPEVLKTNGYGIYKDLFSFGRIAMELLVDKKGTETKARLEQM